MRAIKIKHLVLKKDFTTKKMKKLICSCKRDKVLTHHSQSISDKSSIFQTLKV